MHKRFKLKLALFIFSIMAILLNFVSNVHGIYGGKEEQGYTFVGYMMSDISENQVGLCGINFISPRIGITAGHCLDIGNQLYPNIGEFDKNYVHSALEVSQNAISPKYNRNTNYLNAGIGDLGIVELAEDLVLDKYAKITAPTAGCEYYIVGYGKNETRGRYARKGLDVCLENITNERVEVTFNAGEHICVGDSGTGIYQKDTNNLVATISSFESFTTCEEATVFYATRLDSNKDFIEQYVDLDDPVSNSSSSSSSTSTTITSVSTQELTQEDTQSILVMILCCASICLISVIFPLILWLLIKLTSSKPRLQDEQFINQPHIKSSEPE